MSTRTYNSPLREEQQAQTRERILEQVVEILATPGVELTVAEAATRARVSVRTAYRYFPTREALLDAFHAWSSERMGFVAMPKKLEDVVEYAASLGKSFAANESVLRAQQRTETSEEVRRRRKQNNIRAVSKLVEEAAPDVDPVRRMHVAAGTIIALGFDTWLQLRDLWGMDHDECIAMMQWHVSTLIASLKSTGRPARR